MVFFNKYLRIKSRMRKVININPIYKTLPKIRARIKEVQTVKQVIHEKSFNKNFVLNEFVKDRLTKRYSM
jgi:hypothetical protein